MRTLSRWLPQTLILLVFVLVPAVVLLAGNAADLPLGSYREVRPIEEGLVTDPPMPLAPQASAWLTTPNWQILLTDFGYSDVFWERKPHWLRAYPWSYSYFWDEVLSGEWAAAIYYDQIPTPAIAMGPNAGLPQTMWLEPNFLYPNWVTNSNFFVVTPIATWNRGHLPLPYFDTGYSCISNGQVRIEIDYLVWNNQTAMGRCAGVWPWPWVSYVRSDPYILQQKYKITNVTSMGLTNLEFFQFLHGHPGTHETVGFYGDWEVYDPNRKFLAWDNWDIYHYDITQWGRKYLYMWPWLYAYWNWWNYDYVGFHSRVQPNTGRSPSPWGLGEYRGHAAGKPARPGVHWDVEEDNLQPRGPACTLYPSSYPVFGRQVAGAETWKLAASLPPSATVNHDVLLSISNQPYHGWHWGFDWWYWYPYYHWPWWSYPSFYYTWHPWGWPYYRIWIDYPWWWRCYYWPRPPTYPIWFGLAVPTSMTAQAGLTIEGVYFKEYAPEGGGAIQAEFVEDVSVTYDLQENYPWEGYQWHGYSLSDYTLPDSTMVAYIALRAEEDTLGTNPPVYIHCMMGDGEWGWAPYHYDSTLVELAGASVKRTDPVGFRLAQNRPNPFKTTTEIDYGLPASGRVNLAIYNVLGQRVRLLVDDYLQAGNKSAIWDGKNDQGKRVSAGIYMYKLEVGSHAEMKKLILLE